MAHIHLRFVEYRTKFHSGPIAVSATLLCKLLVIITALITAPSYQP